MNAAQRAEAFQGMHRGPGILVIANAWDAASARMFESAGVKAIGTSSAGVAFAHGYADDASLPRDVLLQATAEIVLAVQVPVTADILGGLGDTPQAVADTVRKVISLGALGVNIEDGVDAMNGRQPHLRDLEQQADIIRAAVEAARQAGVNIVVNARTDSHWLKLGDEAEQLRASVARAQRYVEAGASGVFVPSVVRRETIATLVAEIGVPLNILASPGCPSVAELQALGVRRVSLGSGPMRAAMMLTRRIAQDLLGTGTYARIHDDAVPYAQANAMFEQQSVALAAVSASAIK